MQMIITKTDWISGLKGRLGGPGGYYNIGNVFGFLTGLWLQVFATKATTVIGFLIGSPSAIALTVSMVIFFWSGELYHRAWLAEPAPDAGLNKQGDVFSGYGALALGIGLLFLGQPLLAATAGLLHAAGKFGSAYSQGYIAPFWPKHWPDMWRSAVIVSRVPAILAVLIELGYIWSSPDQTNLPNLVGPISLLICYLLWARADMLLFRSSK